MSELPAFPVSRPRRLRSHPLLRELVRETELSPRDLILPLFVRPGKGVRQEIGSMPGNYQLSVDTLVEEVGAARELGMRRARVLSRYGLHVSADRWEDAYGSKTPMAQAAPASCVSCGFLVPIGGSLGQAFGVCANEFSPADGRVVSLAYGCGGHSEAAVMPKPPQPAPPVIDETKVDPFPLRPAADSGSVPVVSDEDAAELGHS